MIGQLKALLGLGLALTLVSATAVAQDKPKRKKKAATTTEAAATADAKPAAKAETADAKAAKAEAPKGDKLAPGEQLNFRIEDTSVPTNGVPVFNFKEGGEALTPSNPNTYNDSVAEDAPFRAYIGYPKNRFSAVVVPKNVAATWTSSGQDFNFRSNSLGYGVAYDLVITPRISMGVDYTHSELKMDAAKAGARAFLSSKASYDTYFAKFQYCFFGSSNFFQQICPGIDVGNDAYPILSYTVNGSTLKLDRLQDIVLGPKLTYQSPITDKVLFRATAGYNYGMGIGSSGSVSSKSNASYYLKIGSGWDFNPHHGMGLDIFWQNRNTKTSDKTSLATDEWTTKSTELGVRVAYTYTL